MLSFKRDTSGRYVISFFFIAYACVFIPASSILAVEDQQELYPTIGKKAEVTPPPVEADKSRLDFSASVITGYDTNIYLDHYDATASMFIQESFGADVSSALLDNLTLRVGYDLASIKYTRESEPDLLDNIINGGLDIDVTDTLLLSVDYSADFVEFPHDKAEDYVINTCELGLRHDITDEFYQKIIYSLSHKYYSKWKTRSRDGFRRLGKREDWRNTIGHQLGYYLSDKTFIRADNAFYFNDSNEPFLSYYDYYVLKSKATVIHLITDSLYGSANVGYEYKRYDNRNISDGDDNQRDRLIMCGASLFYDITPNVSVGTGFDYKRNISNEGNQKYRDFIISSGIYSRF